jgi:SAM-dependent methyltransferase
MGNALRTDDLQSEDREIQNMTAAGAGNSAANQGVGKETEIYTRRFSESQERLRSETWEVLCREFFQPLIKSDSTIVDLGAGDGLFVRNIQAKRRVAVDLSPHVEELKKVGIETLVAPATEFATKLGGKADVIFMSNFLEHLPAKRLVLDVLDECKKALAPGGRVMILQPNIRYVGADYWDYIDHHIALTEHSLVEALEVSGFQIEKLIPRFLPYTAKSKTGSIAELGGGALVSLYLKMPLLWRFFGQQTFVVARS